MTPSPREVFVALHAVGLLVGLQAGALLPWWLSGAPAWALAAVVHHAAPRWLPHPFDGDDRWGAPLACPRLAEEVRAHVLACRSAVAGAFVGGCLGALAADLQEIWPALGVTDAATAATFGWYFAAAAVVMSAVVVDADALARMGAAWFAGTFYVGMVAAIGAFTVLLRVVGP